MPSGIHVPAYIHHTPSPHMTWVPRSPGAGKNNNPCRSQITQDYNIMQLCPNSIHCPMSPFHTLANVPIPYIVQCPHSIHCPMSPFHTLSNVPIPYIVQCPNSIHCPMSPFHTLSNVPIPYIGQCHNSIHWPMSQFHTLSNVPIPCMCSL